MAALSFAEVVHFREQKSPDSDQIKITRICQTVTSELEK